MLLVVELNAEQQQFGIIMKKQPVSVTLLTVSGTKEGVPRPRPCLYWRTLRSGLPNHQYAVYLYEHRQSRKLFNTLGILPPHAVSDHYREVLRGQNYQELLVKIAHFTFSEDTAVTLLLEVQEA